jgi:hypothetical protein
MHDGPPADLVSEGARIAGAAAEEGLVVRVAGGVGIGMTCPSASHEPLKRAYADLDVVGRSRDRPKIVEFFVSLGYIPDKEFNALHGSRQLFFWDSSNQRQLDVFLDRLDMCHTIKLGDRLEITGETLTPADLLLTKLQIVESNEKDLLDIVTMFVDHRLSEDESGINLQYVSRLTSEDWGLWKTITTSAERAGIFVDELNGFDRAELAQSSIRQFVVALETFPKSRAWRVRAKIGERKRGTNCRRNLTSVRESITSRRRSQGNSGRNAPKEDQTPGRRVRVGIRSSRQR